MFIGRYQLGKMVPLLLVTRNSAGAPAVPNAPPTATLWSPTTKIGVELLPIIERYVNNGMFQGHVFLNDTFAVGLYQVSYYFEIGSYQGIENDNFEIMPGGDGDGAINSMYFYQRPQASFIVQSKDSGKIVQGRNPIF